MKRLPLTHDEALAENRLLREMLALRVAGGRLYGDDGELFDSTERPYIDFRNDRAQDISRKLTERGLRKLNNPHWLPREEPVSLAATRLLLGEAVIHSGDRYYEQRQGRYYEWYAQAAYPACMRTIEPVEVLGFSPIKLDYTALKAYNDRWEVLSHRDMVKRFGWWSNPYYKDFQYDGSVDVEAMEAFIAAHPTPELFRDSHMSSLLWTQYFKDQEDAAQPQDPGGDLGR